ncbi:MAG: hypothetical protein IH934_00020 [Nanoarchaeota archaeon]|nr:hypothetical protein [Nanoarchaeota archaeon]
MAEEKECCVHNRPVEECKECAEKAEAGECCVHGRDVGECKECKSGSSGCTC